MSESVNQVKHIAHNMEFSSTESLSEGSI